MSDVRDGRLSVNAASKSHYVPRRALRRYLTTKTIVKAKLVGKSTLTKKIRKVNCVQEFSIWLKLDTLVENTQVKCL